MAMFFMVLVYNNNPGMDQIMMYGAFVHLGS